MFQDFLHLKYTWMFWTVEMRACWRGGQQTSGLNIWKIFGDVLPSTEAIFSPIKCLSWVCCSQKHAGGLEMKSFLNVWLGWGTTAHPIWNTNKFLLISSGFFRASFGKNVIKSYSNIIQKVNVLWLAWFLSPPQLVFDIHKGDLLVVYIKTQLSGMKKEMDFETAQKCALWFAQDGSYFTKWLNIKSGILRTLWLSRPVCPVFLLLFLLTQAPDTLWKCW